MGQNMKRYFARLLAIVAISLLCDGQVEGRGFGGGGFHGGGFGGGGGYRGGGFGGGGYGGDRFGGYSADRFGGDRFGGGGFGGGYGENRSGGGFNADRLGGLGGDRYGNWGGGGLDRNADLGRTTGANAAGGDWRSAFAGTRFPTDFGLSHYSAFNAAGVNHVTANWTHGDIADRTGYIRNNFNYYNCFHPGWYANHPGCWFAAGWAAGAAWTTATWPILSSWCAIPVAPIYYDYGNNVVYQNNDVYVDGQDVGTAQNYAQQAITIADQGQQADAPPDQEWKPLGVFALVPGDQKTSDNLFQLAINKQGVIRGNYYDGLMDSTTPVYGSVDKKTQRAAWTIGKKKDRVFEAGIDNLTKSETPVLVHFGTDRTQQWLLVRVRQPDSTPQ